MASDEMVAVNGLGVRVRMVPFFGEGRIFNVRRESAGAGLGLVTAGGKRGQEKISAVTLGTAIKHNKEIWLSMGGECTGEFAIWALWE